jgi:hypothetical protein
MSNVYGQTGYIIDGYISAAVGTEEEIVGDALLSEQAFSKACTDVIEFTDRCEKQGLSLGIEENEYDLATIGHDLWLTRNWHGSGFWDGDYPQPLGDQLTDIAHSMGEQLLYVGDDGLLYLT